MATLTEIAETNVREHLKDNPCRGIVVGLDKSGKQVQISWIMGRSENSQNRVYVVENGILKTEPADPSKVQDASLIIYNVMRACGNAHIVSNGDQTDTACAGMNKEYLSFFDALCRRCCEPDAPNFTPRITGAQDSSMPYVVCLSLLKADPFAKADWIETDARIKQGSTEAQKHHKQAFLTIRDEFKRAVEPGFGYMLTTYMPGSKELPSFKGEPLLVPIRGSLEEAMQYFWNALEPAFRVAVGGKEISSSESRYAEPINRFAKK